MKQLLRLSLATFFLFGLLAVSSPKAFALYNFTLSANPTTVLINGGTSTITAHVSFAGNPLSGHTIQFSIYSGPAHPGSVSPTSASTNANGDATTTYTSGSDTGQVTIKAQDMTQAGQPVRYCTVTVCGVFVM